MFSSYIINPFKSYVIAPLQGLLADLPIEHLINLDNITTFDINLMYNLSKKIKRNHVIQPDEPLLVTLDNKEYQVQFMEQVVLDGLIVVKPEAANSLDEVQNQHYKGVVRRALTTVDSQYIPNNCVTVSVIDGGDFKRIGFVSFTQQMIIYERKNLPGEYRLAVLDHPFAEGMFGSVSRCLTTVVYDAQSDIIYSKRKYDSETGVLRKPRIIKKMKSCYASMFNGLSTAETEFAAAADFAPYLKMKKPSIVRNYDTPSENMDFLVSAYFAGATLENVIHLPLINDHVMKMGGIIPSEHFTLQFKSDLDRLLLCFALAIEVKKITDRGGVHRDIKPQNIIVSRNADGTWNVKIIDFGLAVKIANRDTSAAGTPIYTSPEIANCTYYATGLSDVYSLHRTFENIFARFAPWDPDCFRSHMSDPFEYKPNVEASYDHADRDFVQPHIDQLLELMRENDREKRIDIDGVINHLMESIKKLSPDIDLTPYLSSLHPLEAPLESCSAAAAAAAPHAPTNNGEYTCRALSPYTLALAYI